MNTILLTGFGPFPGAPSNPTGALAQRLARRQRPAFTNIRRIAHVFHTSYAAVERDLPSLITRHKPDAILMFGLATRTPYLRIETRAQNAASMLFADAERCKPSARHLSQSTLSAMAIRAPSTNLLQAARAAGVPVRLSRDAGRYLCNAVFWRALEAAGHRDGPRVVAFVHLPRVRPGLTLGDLTRGGEAILLAVLAAARRPH